MTKYRCKEPLELLKYDDDGCLSENATVIIEVGDVFLKDDTHHRIIGGISSVRLKSDALWMEIAESTLKEHFEEVEE